MQFKDYSFCATVQVMDGCAITKDSCLYYHDQSMSLNCGQRDDWHLFNNRNTKRSVNMEVLSEIFVYSWLTSRIVELLLSKYTSHQPLLWVEQTSLPIEFALAMGYSQPRLKHVCSEGLAFSCFSQGLEKNILVQRGWETCGDLGSTSILEPRPVLISPNWPMY